MSNKGYGSLDRLVKMCVDNSITDIDVVKNKEYVFDDNLIVNKNFVGYDYATNYVEPS